MRISQEAYDTIRARLDASAEGFSALQRYTIDWCGQPSTLVLQTVRVRRRSKHYAVRKSRRPTRSLPDARRNGSGRGTDDSEAIEILLINSNTAEVGM
jgi:hypothetical protein